jgi:hypothetical protein
MVRNVFRVLQRIRRIVSPFIGFEVPNPDSDVRGVEFDAALQAPLWWLCQLRRSWRVGQPGPIGLPPSVDFKPSCASRMCTEGARLICVMYTASMSDRAGCSRGGSTASPLIPIPCGSSADASNSSVAARRKATSSVRLPKPRHSPVCGSSRNARQTACPAPATRQRRSR